MPEPAPKPLPTIAPLIGEAVGTFMLVLFGCGVVHAAVLTGAQSGLWQVAVVWGVGIMLAIYTVGAISGAHLNPAVTLALAVWGRHAWGRVPGYMAAQFCGAFLGAAALFCAFQGPLSAKEREKGVVRGEPGSIVTAMCYGEYFPNPGSLATSPGPYDPAKKRELMQTVSHGTAFGVEVLGTLILALVIFAVTDEANRGRPSPQMAPVFIGLTVAALISLFAPLTQACFNPARDFGPRVFAALAGWGRVAWPGPADLGWLTVYIIAPCVGAVLGAGLYEKLLRPFMRGA